METSSKWLFKTEQRAKDFLASSEMGYDPEYQGSMDTAWHYWMQDEYYEDRKLWLNGLHAKVPIRFTKSII